MVCFVGRLISEQTGNLVQSQNGPAAVSRTGANPLVSKSILLLNRCAIADKDVCEKASRGLSDESEDLLSAHAVLHLLGLRCPLRMERFHAFAD